MRQCRAVILLLFALGLFFSLSGWTCASAAGQDDAAAYKITGVSVDVSAASAAAARDLAILQAQRLAFNELALRLGVAGKAATPDDNTLASLVQAFEVEKEKTSTVRYLGTLTVQFNPAATRAFFEKRGASFSDIRSRPILVLPVESVQGRTLLWEEETPWRKAWEAEQQKTGLVPLVVPVGEVEDVSLIGGADAVQGKGDALEAIQKKYGAVGALVATLTLSQDPPAAGESPRIAVVRYEGQTPVGEPETLTLPAASSPDAFAGALADGVKQIRTELEKNWRKTAKTLAGPSAHIMVSMQVDSLSAWNALKAKMETVTGVAKVRTLALGRNEAKVDLEFHGDLPALQKAFSQLGLALEQGPSGWSVRAGGV